MINKPLAETVAFYFGGIATAWFCYWQEHFGAGLMLLVMLIAYWLQLRETYLKRLFLVVVFITTFILISWSLQNSRDLQQTYTSLNTTKLECYIVRKEKETNWQVTYLCNLLAVNNTAEDGRILLQVSPEISLNAGDKVKAQAQWQPATPARNWTNYSYEKYLLTKNIHGVFRVKKLVELQKFNSVKARFYSWTDKINFQVGELLSSENSGLLTAFLLGDKDNIQPQNYENIQGAGVAHLVVLSGFHLILIVSFLELLVTKLFSSRPVREFSIYFCMLVYIAVTGFQISLLRAAFMLIITRNTKWTPYNGLLLVALMFAVIRPLIIMDIGFQLSLLAVLGLKSISKNQAQLYLKEQALNYLVIQVLILPVLAWNFGCTSLWGLLGSLVLTPLSVMMMVLGGAYLLVALTPIQALLLPSLNMLGESFLWLAEKISQMPGSHFYLGNGNLGIWLVYYLAVFSGLVWYQQGMNLNIRVKIWRFRDKFFSKYLLGFLGVVILSIPILWDNSLNIYFLDVGEGDSAFILTPNGTKILIDAGKGSELKYFLRARGVSSIDVLVITHPHADHYRGLFYCLDQIRIKEAYMYLNGDEEEYQELVAQLSSMGTKIHKPLSKGVWESKDGAKFTMLVPGANLPAVDWNEKGIVIELEYGKHRFLLTADATRTNLENLVVQNAPKPMTVIKVPHHGAGGSWNKEFWDRYQPKWAVISVGPNRYGHPDSNIVKSLKTMGISVLRTDKARGIKFECSETGIKVNQYNSEN